MAADEEFSLEGKNILLPYVRHQGHMNACYAYTSGEAVQAWHAAIYSLDPFELSTQQIVDHLPCFFDYENSRKRKDLSGCYYSNHPDVLGYILAEGLVKDEYYVKRLSRVDRDIIPVPNVTRYSIRDFGFLFQIGMPSRLKKSYETEMTMEGINSIIREQPILGVTKVYKSFVDFQGEGLYMGPDAGELPETVLHSILIVGYGIANGVHYYKIKNSWGITWGSQGFGKIRRDLVYRLAYPIAPIERNPEPEEVALPVTKIKNTKPPRSKWHRSTSKKLPSKSSGPTKFGAQGFGTEGRLKTNALWDSSEDFLYGCDEDIVDTDCEPDVEFEYDIEDEDKDGSTGENCSINAEQNKKKKVMIDREELAGAHPWHLEANDESTDHDGQKSTNEKGTEKKNESQLKTDKNAGTKPSPVRAIETGLVIEGGVG